MCLHSRAYNCFGQVEKLPKRKVESINELREGDHVAFKRPGYWHHGIIVKVDIKKEEVCVMEYTNTMKTFCLNLVALTPFKAEIQRNQYKFGNQVIHLVEHEEDYNREDCRQRALEREFEKKYNILTHNCEDFANYCVTGIEKSYQVKTCIRNMLETICTLAAPTVGICFILLITELFVTLVLDKTVTGPVGLDDFETGFNMNVTNSTDCCTIECCNSTNTLQKRIATRTHKINRILFTLVAAFPCFFIQFIFISSDIRRASRQRSEGILEDRHFEDAVGKRVTTGVMIVLCMIAGSVIGELYWDCRSVPCAFLGGIIGILCGYPVSLLFGCAGTWLRTKCAFLAHLWGAYAIPVALSGVRCLSFVVRCTSYVACRLCRLCRP